MWPSWSCRCPPGKAGLAGVHLVNVVKVVLQVSAWSVWSSWSCTCEPGQCGQVGVVRVHLGSVIKLVLYDDRAQSTTRGALMELFIGDYNYQRVTVPPGVWNGFKGIGPAEGIVANCATIPHDPSEISRLDPFSSKIPYSWELKHG